MDRFNPDSNNTPNPVEEQTPHSGVHYDEKPVKDFDKTKLAEAVDQGLITVPEDVSPLVADIPPTNPPSRGAEQASPQPERKKLGVGAKIGAGLAGLALAGGAVFGVTSAMNSGDNTPPEKDDKGTSQNDTGNENPNTNNGEEKPPVEEPVETEKTFEQLVEENKIEAGLSAEEYAEALQDRLDSWAFAGSDNEELIDGWIQADDKTAFEDNVAASQTAIYTNALFTPGFHNEQSLINSQVNFTSYNAVWLGRWLRSVDIDSRKGTLTLESVVEQAEVISENPETNERVIYMAGYTTNNGEDAKFVNESVRQKTIDANGDSWDHTLTLKTIDGVEYITKWED